MGLHELTKKGVDAINKKLQATCNHSMNDYEKEALDKSNCEWLEEKADVVSKQFGYGGLKDKHFRDVLGLTDKSLEKKVVT